MVPLPLPLELNPLPWHPCVAVEIAICRGGRFTSACWRAGAGVTQWGGGTVPAGPWPGAVVAGGQHVPCSSRGLGHRWHQQCSYLTRYSYGFDFLLVSEVNSQQKWWPCCWWQCGWSVTPWPLFSHDQAVLHPFIPRICTLHPCCQCLRVRFFQ